MKSIQLLVAVPVFILGYTSCTGNEYSSSSFVVRDSAGIQIAVSQGPSWAPGKEWSVATSPELRIGTVEGEEAYRFFRITDATLVSDGRIAVADGGSGDIKMFDLDGHHIVTVGRQGEGPGEFQSIRRFIAASTDRLTVFDNRLRRITVFSLDGDLMETRAVEVMASGSSPMPIGDIRAIGDHGLVGMDGNVLAPGSTPSLVRDTAYFFSLKGGSEEDQPIFAVPGAWTEYASFDGSSTVRTQPLTPTPSWDTDRNRLVISTGERFEFRILDETGKLNLIVRLEEDPSPVTAEDTQSWKDLYLDRAPEDQRDLLDRALGVFTMPDHLPAYSGLHVDPQGYVWAGRFGSPGVGTVESWDVFARNGAYQGNLKTPPGLRVLEIGEEYILGTWADELGVEYVQRHYLARGNG